MIAVDASVVVAAFASWHELHEPARATIERDDVRLPALESYSVLTRLPPPHRAPARLVLEFLADRFPAPLLTLDAEAHRHLLGDLGEARIDGGSTYDALVAVTAREAGAVLVTCDRRARPTYERVHAAIEYLAG